MKNENNIEIEAVKFGRGEFKLMTYNGGRDALYEFELASLPEDSKWIAYAYSQSEYEGHGYAIVAHDDGRYSLYDLGHCSCYGPLEEEASEIVSTREGIEALIGRDFNGREIVPTDWCSAELNQLWAAVKLAMKLNP